MFKQAAPAICVVLILLTLVTFLSSSLVYAISPSDSLRNFAADTSKAQDEDTSTCKGSGVLGWIICPVVTTLLEGAQTLTDELVVPLLEIQPLNQQKNGALFEVWKNFRTLANIAFVLVFFVIIFSTAINNRE